MRLPTFLVPLVGLVLAFCPKATLTYARQGSHSADFGKWVT